MKLIPLNKGKYAIVDDWNYDYLMQWKWHIQPSRYTHYAVRTDYSNGEKKDRRMHREIMKTDDSTVIIDHKDGDGLNCLESNLRKCTILENNQNSRSRKKSTSKYIGVSFKAKNKKWVAQISVNKKIKHLGLFSSEIEAAKARDSAAKIYHKDFAYLNF